MSDQIASTDGGQGAAPASSSAALASTAAAPASTGAPSATPAAPAAPASSWLTGLDEVTTGYAQNKGWDNPSKAIDSYRNLEKLLGADRAGNTVILPKPEADAKEWGAVFDRLGRPSDAKGYNVPVPQGGDQKVQESVLAKMHELGLTKTQGEELANWYNNMSVEAATQQAAQREIAFQQEDTALKTEWGGAYTQNLAQAQQGARALGLDADTIDKLSDTLGHKATMNLMQKIGSGLKEDSLVTNDGQSSYGNAMTPGQAKAQIQSLMADRNFVSRYMSGEAEAKAKMAALHDWAYPAE